MRLCLERQFYTLEEVIKILSERDPIIVLDYPKGSYKGFGDENRKVKLPFDYGELPQFLNRSDGMGWDVLLTPSSSLQDDLKPVGVVIVSSDIEEWKRRIPNSKKLREENPVGNDKIIFSKDGRVSKKDRKILEDFFGKLWQFERIDWFKVRY